MRHVAVEPTHENGWASWRCPECDQDCSSDNLCDCCNDDMWLWLYPDAD